jgi:C-terminal processing protease CtpA/Prc
MLSPTFSSDIFAKIIYNEKRSNENKIIYYDKDALANALGVTDVFCITSEQTQGAAEWVIRALSASLGSDHVYVIGTTTSGQTVITEPIKSDYCATLYPVVAYVADKNDNYNYFSGIIPDYEINDVNSVELFPYGDTNEVVLSFILDEIANFF